MRETRTGLLDAIGSAVWGLRRLESEIQGLQGEEKGLGAAVSTSDEAPNGEVTGGGISAASPAPAPRRWWLNVYTWDGEVTGAYVRYSRKEAEECAVHPAHSRGTLEHVEVVEAAALEAVKQEKADTFAHLTDVYHALGVRWCDDPFAAIGDLRAKLAEAQRFAKRWEDDAMWFSLNEDYYRKLVVRIGEGFGSDAYTSDDGSVQQDVLCAKVPELVEGLRAKLAAAERERDAARAELAKARTVTNEQVESAITAATQMHGYTLREKITQAFRAAGFTVEGDA